MSPALGASIPRAGWDLPVMTPTSPVSAQAAVTSVQVLPNTDEQGSLCLSFPQSIVEDPLFMGPVPNIPGPTWGGKKRSPRPPALGPSRCPISTEPRGPSLGSHPGPGNPECDLTHEAVGPAHRWRVARGSPVSARGGGEAGHSWERAVDLGSMQLVALRGQMDEDQGDG